MTAIQTQLATPAAAGRTISPVLVTMLALSAIGAWSVWQQNADVVATLGVTALIGIGAWIVYGLVAVAIVVALQRFARRPAWTVALALLWGGTAVFWVSTEANGAMSTIFLRTIGSDPHAWVSTPVIEESMKALGVLGLLLVPVLRRFRTLDGLFYGVLVGAGFQVVEDAFYTLTQVSNDPGGSIPAIVGILILRGLTVGLFTHAVYTGLVGAAIGWAAAGPKGTRGRRALGVVAALLAAIVVHGTFNTQDELTIVNTGAALLPFVVLLVVIWRARRGELEHLAQVGAETHGWGVLDGDSLALMAGPRPTDRATRRLRGRVRRFAWVADHLGADGPQGRRAAAALHESA